MMLMSAVEMAVKCCDVSSSPGECYQQDKGLKVLEVVEVEVIF
jgi:hypothetical protein